MNRAISDDSSRSLRILHLAYQDPAMPGSGGGAVRTHEIDHRLASRHHITALCMKWPGYRDRREDGVSYIHVGLNGGYLIRVLSYFAVLPFAIRRFKADLIVEDFGAPFSSALIPLWTRRPVIASVQWLNAREKSRQYKMPFALVEHLGIRLYRDFIVMSEDLADRIKAENQTANVTVIPNGISKEALSVSADRNNKIVFLGRLESSQKGTDLLLESFASVLDSIDVTLVLAGSGPDEDALRRQAKDLGIEDRVEFAGWVSGDSKHRLLASAKVVVMPSRFETFGMVAIESLACGTPVVAFDIPCLREVVPSQCGVLVEPFDTDRFSEAVRELLNDDRLREQMGRRGRKFVKRFDWDEIALKQEGAYYQALGLRA